MTDRDDFEMWFSQKGRFPKDVERSGEGYKEENATRSWLAWQEARATAELSRDSVIEECAKVCEKIADLLKTGSVATAVETAEGCASEIRALKSQQDAAIESKPAVQSAWHPIETARKDREIWAFNGEQARMKWSEGTDWALWIWADELMSEVDPEPDQPTHWQPLPKPPADAAIDSQRSGKSNG